jgi:predicted nucleotidyltransferase
MQAAVSMKTSLDHLPEAKRERIAAIAALLQAEAAVEMVILFGSYARGDWVEDPENGYFSDFDLLVVVATEELARKDGLWTGLSQRAQAIAGRTPVTLIAHDIKEVNHELRLGQYFFIDILREGVVVYSSRRVQLATPKALEPADRLKLGLVNFRYWFGSANEFWRIAGHSAGRGLGPHAAFLLHQSVERYFSATLLVYSGYKPKTHNIEELANQTGPLHPVLEGALPRTEEEDKRLFDLLRRA